MLPPISFIILAAVVTEGFAECPASPSLTVVIYDDVGVERALLYRSQREATRILGDLGYPVLWVHCAAAGEIAPAGELCQQKSGPMTLVLHLLPENLTRRNAPKGSMGFAVPPGGREFEQYCCVFYGRVQQVSHPPLTERVVLGHAITHELGHRLLGANAHAGYGIMSAQWTPRELALAARGQLLFSEVERRKMRLNMVRRASVAALQNPQCSER